MKEYIEREALQKAINTEISEHAEDAKESLYERGYNNGLMMAYALLLNAPAADVEEVRHGRWVEKKRWSMGKWHKWLECSKCGHVDYDLDMYEDMPFTGPGNYCPNCGAKMDKEE